MILFLVISFITCAMGQRIDQYNRAPDYLYQHFIRNNHNQTGDYTSHQLAKQEDIQGSLPQPGSGLAVIANNAGKDTGFNAQMQMGHGPIVPPQYNLQNLMKIPPRYIYRTGFPPLEIKVVPPSSLRSTTSTPIIVQQGVSSEPLKPLSSEPETTTYNINDEYNETAIPITTEATVETSEQIKIESPKEPTFNDYRAHLRPEEDKVQVEMEQIIQTEIREPTAVKIGIGPHQKESAIKIYPAVTTKPLMPPFQQWLIPENQKSQTPYSTHTQLHSSEMHSANVLVPIKVFFYPEPSKSTLRSPPQLKVFAPAWAFILLPRA